MGTRLVLRKHPRHACHTQGRANHTGQGYYTTERGHPSYAAQTSHARYTTERKHPRHACHAQGRANHTGQAHYTAERGHPSHAVQTNACVEL